jgi:hypothetical protein
LLLREIALSELSTIDGNPNSILIEWADSDLLAHLAPIDDFQPPAGTHCFSIENVMNVAGCYADAVNAPTQNLPGSAIAVGIPNFPESFNPDHLLFLPDKLTHILSRPSDTFVYVLCNKSVYAAVYTGAAPAIALTNVWPGRWFRVAHERLSSVRAALRLRVEARGRKDGRRRPS